MNLESDISRVGLGDKSFGNSELCVSGMAAGELFENPVVSQGGTEGNMALKQINKAESTKANQFSHYFLRNRDGGAVHEHPVHDIFREMEGHVTKALGTVQHGRQRVTRAAPTSRRDDSTASRHVSRERTVDPVHVGHRWIQAAAPGPRPDVVPPPPGRRDAI